MAAKFQQQAYDVLTSPAVARAFDLEQETPKLRDRYGRNLWGQACLLARRLAEAGTAVVSVIANTPQTGPTFTNWDDHPGNATRPGHFAEYMRVRLPYFDQAVAALIDDVFARGLDRKILVVVGVPVVFNGDARGHGETLQTPTKVECTLTTST